MERSIIPIKGVDIQSNHVHNKDNGSCLSIDKLRPVGNVEDKKWEPINDVESLFKTDVFNIKQTAYKAEFNPSVTLVPKSLRFSTDGTKMFYGRDTGSSSDIFQFSLSTPWDISTASYQTFVNISSSGRLRSIFFRPDGLRMWVLLENMIVWQYNLGTAWALATLSFDVASTAIFDVAESGRSIWFKSDGTKLILHSFEVGVSEFFYAIDLSSSPWDIDGVDIGSPESFIGLNHSAFSSATYTPGAFGGVPGEIAITEEGTKIFLPEGNDSVVYQLDISTSWDLSTLTYTEGALIDISSIVSYVNGVFVSEDNGYLYFLDTSSDNRTYQYSLLDLFSAHYEFDRWYFVMTGVSHMKLLSSQNTGQANEIITELLIYDFATLLGATEDNIITECSWSYINKKLYLCFHSADYNFNTIFRISENQVYPNVIRPKYSIYSATQNDTTESVTDFDILYPNLTQVPKISIGLVEKNQVGGRFSAAAFSSGVQKLNK